MDKLKVGTRKSQLSRRQTDIAIGALKAAHSDLDVEIVPFRPEATPFWTSPSGS